MFVCSLQFRAFRWCVTCFSAAIAHDIQERCDRFIEESFELVQSLNYDMGRVKELLDYVAQRSKGDSHQELGGVMITLACLATAADLNMDDAIEDEYQRIMLPSTMEKIRAKQKAKPKLQAIPVPLLRYRHKKRGTLYTVKKDAKLQIANLNLLVDNTVMVVYEAEDGTWCVRPTQEFYDGRFEEIKPKA